MTEKTRELLEKYATSIRRRLAVARENVRFTELCMTKYGEKQWQEPHNKNLAQALRLESLLGDIENELALAEEITN